jgi:hypothetical protein
MIIAQCKGDYCVLSLMLDRTLTIDYSLCLDNSFEMTAIQVGTVVPINCGLYGNGMRDFTVLKVGYVEDCSFDASNLGNSKVSQSGKTVWETSPPGLKLDLGIISPRCIPWTTARFGAPE